MRLNFTAPLNSLGFGITGLNLLRELSVHAEVALWPLGSLEAPAGSGELIRACLARQASYDVAAPSLRLYHQFDLAQHVGRGIHAAFVIFELDRFRPVELHHLRQQDVLFVCSRWAEKVLQEAGLSCRIVVAPLGVDETLFAPAPSQEGPTRFLCVGKWELRKGHDVLLEAFAKAFRPSDDVELTLLCHNPCFPTAEALKRYNSQWEAMAARSPMAEKIVVYRSRLASQKDVAALMATSDCGVFPSHSEGWGLESAEMLAMGKQVILTNYAGHTEYATRENSLLIDCGLVEDAHDGVWFRADLPEWQGKPGRWASLGSRQQEQLIEHLRSIHKKKQEGSSLINQAGIDSMKAFTWKRTAEAVLAGL